MSISWHWIPKASRSFASPSCFPAFPEKAWRTFGFPSSAFPIFPSSLLIQVPGLWSLLLMSCFVVRVGLALSILLRLILSFHSLGMRLIRSLYSFSLIGRFCLRLLLLSLPYLFRSDLQSCSLTALFKTLVHVYAVGRTMVSGPARGPAAPA